MRLIDADALRDELLGEYAFTEEEDCIAYYIDNAPTIDAVPVVHGYWIYEQRGKWIYAKCNLCGKVQDVRSNYCPNCGARMDGKEQTDE